MRLTMIADSNPPPIYEQILEDQVETQWPGRGQLDEQRDGFRATAIERRRERDRDRKQFRRMIDREVKRAAILRRIREVDGIGEIECPCGCGRVMPIETDPAAPGRPRKYATIGCLWRAAKRRVRDALTGKSAAVQ